jgi:hypothetical protein
MTFVNGEVQARFSPDSGGRSATLAVVVGSEFAVEPDLGHFSANAPAVGR